MKSTAARVAVTSLAVGSLIVLSWYASLEPDHMRGGGLPLRTATGSAPALHSVERDSRSDNGASALADTEATSTRKFTIQPLVSTMSVLAAPKPSASKLCRATAVLTGPLPDGPWEYATVKPKAMPRRGDCRTRDGCYMADMVDSDAERIVVEWDGVPCSFSSENVELGWGRVTTAEFVVTP